MSEQVNLTPEQIAAMREQKMESFRKMGLPPGAGQMSQITEMPPTRQQIAQQEVAQQKAAQANPEGNVVMEQESAEDMTQSIRQQINEERTQKQQYGAHFTSDKYQKLMAIKNGNLRQEYDVHKRVSSNPGTGGAATGYQLPVSKAGQKRGTQGMGQQPVSANAIAPTATPSKNSREAALIENMFAGTSSPRFSVASNIEQGGNLINEESSYGGDFNSKWNTKKASFQNGQPGTTQQPPHTSNGEIQEMKEMLKMLIEAQVSGTQPQVIQEIRQPKQPQHDIKALKSMMVEIAKKVSTIMIKEVLEEYTKVQKKNAVKNLGNNYVEINGKRYKAVS